MNKFIAMIILKPDIKNKRIDNVQNSILNMFEQNTKVHKIWYLGKKQLDFKNKKLSVKNLLTNEDMYIAICFSIRVLCN